MEDKNNKDLKDIVGHQFYEVMSNTIVTNILHYISICKKHNIEEVRLNLALQQYIEEAKINGIKVPKSKGSKHSGTGVLIGDPTSFSSISYKKPIADTSVKYYYGSIPYYLTEEDIGDGLLLCVDQDNKALLAWDTINEVEVMFDGDDKVWLSDKGYKISPYIDRL